ncbi:LCP family protein required for cell wall assembly [Breznakia sp. PF5-3]|uniref:LCP family protein n=1 Tax=unclassified Breznakia TaxID=2623764 RepID=UPI0024069C3F|nr:MULTISPECIES: LCP family protein [unclassified Breznakia]MDF9823754.1 LCP family protein required for cell wall assembly [Breznakia sp. PM6-1]MDF9834552.1 LCP family protein required for cell wall assembly [Breznakia sp. PF5-3]MDF9838255.1 LCP family protein required for cell wall assembly [Breznakia sp. PFB2-8]MDF9860271.1 LCP family protein required for cell wall assembly [Breznakia sp. PH5-24]
MKTKGQLKRKISWGRVIDCIYLIAYPVIAGYLLFLLKKFTNKYIILAFVAFALIYAICILSMFLKKQAIEIVRRILMVLITGALIFASVFVKNLSDGFSGITDGSNNVSETKITMDIMVLNNEINTVENIEDLSGKSIGFQNASDKKACEDVKKDLKKRISDTYEQIQYEDYQSMYDAYYRGLVDAIVVNREQKNLLNSVYAGLYEDSTIIESFTYTYKNKVEGNNIDITKEVFTVYISATDEMDVLSESLSDMNMIMIINPNTNHITTISIPRDSFVPNPAYYGKNDKLTHTGWNGVTNTIEAVEQTFQIDIDFYAKISFSSLIEIVDTLGGIDVNVLNAIEEQDEERSFAEEDLIRLEAGYQRLDGRQALAYARHRKSYLNQDIGRNEAQLEVIKGIINKVTTTEGISKIDDVLKIIPKYVIMNFSDQQLSSFVRKQVDDLKGWTISSVNLTNGRNGSEITAAGGEYEPLSIYYLSRNDVIQVNGVYELIKSPKKLSELTFDLDDLYEPYSTFKDIEGLELVP